MSLVSRGARYPYLRLGCTPKYGCPHGHRLRPDRHRTDPGEGGLSEADEGRAHRRAVPSLRRVRPHREGRGGLLRRDRGHRRLEDPQDRRREGYVDPRSSPRGGPVTVLPEVQVPPASDAFRREAATHLHVTTVR